VAWILKEQNGTSVVHKQGGRSMGGKVQHGLRAEGAMGSDARTKGLVFGLVAGLVATIVIDLITMAVLPFMGLPADGGFSVIGDTAAGFFSLFGIKVAGGVPLGVVLHYLIGVALGVIFGAGVTRIDALRLNSTRKGVGLGFLYTEVISLPILVMPPIILHWTVPATAQWFGFSFVMHAIWGIVLGVIVSYGLRFAVAARRA
jgi:hypothetical protein